MIIPNEIFSSWPGLPQPKTQTKNGSDPGTSAPLFLFTSRFDLFPALLLTVLLIGTKAFEDLGTLQTPFLFFQFFSYS